MASDDSAAISHMCANLTLADVDAEDVSVHLPNVQINTCEGEPAYYAVGRLVTNRSVKFLFFQDTMASVWQPAMGVTMRQLQPQRFLIRFYHETDLNRALADGPWTYEQNLLIMQKLCPEDDPETMPLNFAEFWIQIHSLPIGLRSAVVVSAIGGFLGSLVQTDEKNFDGSMRMYYRVRVSIDITKPLKKQMKLKKDNGTWVFVDFKYERLPTFCFICGVIGHGDRVCPKIAQGFDVKSEKPYGVWWLRAGSRRGVPTAGQKWVAPELDSARKDWRAPGMDDIEKPVANTSSRPNMDVNVSRELSVANMVSSDDLPDVVVADFKRKRGDVASTSETLNETAMECDMIGSKNGQKAGLASQARQEL
ncbi:uncharacterized protein LOC116023546 [Ipomoea triloba]|uniref:uncharacterized protein LOC116023546 n=1 Tax=Ipomoea triloba TaxID=35885 RepID=UPI00125D2768|nr:uncharacterized protein LOC116023546 [Ipomoea triloba]